MLPVALLGSAVYLGLHLFQSHLAHEKYLDEANARVQELERQVDALLAERAQAYPSASSASTASASKTSGSWWPLGK